MIDAQFVDQVLQALAKADGPAMVQIADTLSETPEACTRLLTDLASRFADMAADQVRADNATNTDGFSAGDIQVYYQIATYGQRDLPLAPDPRAGLLMSLLRMLAFAGVQSDAPAQTGGSGGGGQREQSGQSGAAAARAALAGRGKQAASQQPPAALDSSTARVPNTAPDPQSAGRQNKKTVLERLVAGERPSRRASAPGTVPLPSDESDVSADAVSPQEDLSAGDPTSPKPRQTPTVDKSRGAAVANGSAADSNGSQGNPASAAPGETPGITLDRDWPALARSIGLTGRPGQFLLQSQLERIDGNCLHLRVPIDQLAEAGVVDRVTEALQSHLPGARLSVAVGRIDGDTGAIKVAQEQEERLEQARSSLESDPFVRTLLSDFDAIILPDSVRPIENESVNRRENT
jgi:DNA polymerase-3 subunit gamma/tau